MYLFGVSAWRNIVGKMRRFCISWGWDRKISRNVVSFTQYYAVSLSSSLRMEPIDIPKCRIFPTILGRVCFINFEDGTERCPETSYLSHNITPRLLHQAWGRDRKISRNVVSFPKYYAASASSSLRTGPKDIPKRRIFPTILGRALTQNVTTTVYFLHG